MKVEIWSDIMCPFCYIGKRNYEAALKQFADSNDVVIEWRSFQLDPSIPFQMDQEENVFQYLAERKGMSYAQSVQMHASVTETAKRAGLDYRFDKAIVANSFQAHRMIQMAKEKGLGDEAEERFFRAYFTEGKNIGNKDTLVQLGTDIGLTEAEVQEALTNETYARKVEEDIADAHHMGVNGVPFFVFNRRYAVSGAQPPQAFVQALQRSFEEWRKDQ
ncbi:dithiol-disulfide isomerase [Russula earlei]|uniref:Dithiol-disulfide isomerase n=1 Tax=Russula earlei TaxID=71964 RepID=A0ACC0TUU3_9AGAM|nr:dithiol-disulfide isomerase [Russula earlei]